MRFSNSERPRRGAPLSSTLRGRRPSVADPEAAVGDRSPVTPTVVLLGVGVVLLAAALVIPSNAPRAVPTGALAPVAATSDPSSAASVDLAGGSTPEDLWIETEDERAGAGGDTAEPASAFNRPTGEALEGSSSASVAGDDLTQAERAETERRKKASAKRARERKPARKRAAARRAAQRRAANPRRARQPAGSPSTAAPSRPATPPRPASAAPPAAPPARSQAPTRPRTPSRSAVAEEFTGGL